MPYRGEKRKKEKKQNKWKESKTRGAGNTTVLNKWGGKRRDGLFSLAAGLPVATGQFGLAQTEGVRERKKRKKRRRRKRRKRREESQHYCPTEETEKRGWSGGAGGKGRGGEWDEGETADINLVLILMLRLKHARALIMYFWECKCCY